MAMDGRAGGNVISYLMSSSDDAKSCTPCPCPDLPPPSRRWLCVTTLFFLESVTVLAHTGRSRIDVAHAATKIGDRRTRGQASGSGKRYQAKKVYLPTYLSIYILLR